MGILLLLLQGAATKLPPDPRMVTLARVVTFELWAFVGGLAFIVAFQLLTGQINTRGLLSDKSGQANISPSRVQLLTFTLAGAAYYFFHIVDQARIDPTRLPDVPNELLLLLGGSHLIYLGAKAASLLPSLLRRITNPDRQQ